jgi:glycosyltransferase involved in cell wall biosynthesis
MKELLTIIIPSKNESDTLYDCLQFLYNQTDMDGVRVIVADISDDPYSVGILYKARSNFKDKLKIEVIKGGYPSEGRLVGSKLANTPYILFLDADVFLTNNNLLSNIFKKLATSKIELLTTPFQTSKRWNLVFRIFDIFQWLSIKVNSPFAVGGFQLWDRQAYWKAGGYKKDELFAEDYSLSSKSNPKYFHIHKTKGVWTSPRRFESKGVIYMVFLMIQSYINRNNPEFFKQHHNYWV